MDGSEKVKRLKQIRSYLTTSLNDLTESRKTGLRALETFCLAKWRSPISSPQPRRLTKTGIAFSIAKLGITAA